MIQNKIAFVAWGLGLLVSCSAPQSPVEEAVPETIQPIKELSTATIYTTARGTDLRLAQTGTKTFGPGEQPLETQISVFVNPDKTFQELVGIGGAVTDASAEVFAGLSADKQEELLSAYYSQEGIGYSLLRTTIHSSDFGSGSYTYIEEGDTALATFSIEHDRAYRLPMIKRAITEAGGSLLTYVSPWSPPAFMKTTGRMLQGGSLLPEFAPAWARYYAKFIKAYEVEEVPIWGLTIQNEPMATQTWESCIYTAEQERDFLKNHLGPTLASEGLGDKNIIVWDHNRDLITQRANTIFGDPEAAKYAWGIGFHWYETWTGSEPNFENLRRVKESYPDKQLMFTEGCNEKFDPAKYQYWPNAERYGKSMINDFNRGTAGWTDWNILLDDKGGPNHVGNFCFAPIHADSQTGDLIYTPSYYYIGHFSKYIKPGAKRVSTVASRTSLMATTFVNEDGSYATVVMNETDEAIDYQCFVGTQVIEASIPARAIQTLRY
ncbi:glycoside hydrolase family 30 beta sandwich domain-containing protein [Reichenbachiella sp. MSK19-1]|uniref:glycoside hydrolase family 30 protein n=1 Tax=Reichenbachiella sp. MSK19-1 TaxID=1897631 RepID=UPI000E6C123A|nr:glycoside hydrolase family 30 protein [Reichenbachiella sp. MSK19-1]RJE71420.1 glycosyl hydrolase [Reichenbachiella sp. MSK19-1]